MTVKFKNWKPEKVKEMIKVNLKKNGDDAGAYVEADARRRLLAITDPDWGAGYRRFVVGRLLTHLVEEMPNSVDILVGVAVSSDSRHHGFYIETGTARRPAHPFLRPAVFNNGRIIVRLIEGS